MPKGFEARFTLAVLAYAALQLVLRLLIGPALELDEAEAFYHARHLAWGYGPQPPLYFWLQWGLFQILGEGLLALAALKALILAGTVLGLFALLRREAGAGPAAVAALSMSLLPQVVWEGQRALTHTMLALLMTVVVTGLFVRALRMGRWRDHLILGVGVGLGVLSKFNFVLWPLGLLGAALLLPEWRGRLRWRLLGAVAAAGAVVAPVGLWMLENPGLATGSVGKLDLGPGGLATRMVGTSDLLMALLTFFAVPALLLGGFALARLARGRRVPPVARLTAMASGVTLGILWLGMLASGVTEIAVRWLLPLGWGLVPAMTLWLWPGLGQVARQGLASVIVGLWLAVVPLLPYASLVDPGYRGADFGPLVERLRTEEAEAKGLEVENQWVAGNLALLAPDLAPRLLREGEPREPGAVLVLDGEARPDQEAVVIPRGRREVRAVVVAP